MSAPAAAADVVLGMATEGGARALGLERVGRIAPRVLQVVRSRGWDARAADHLVRVSARELAKVIRLVYSGNMILSQEASQALIQMDVQPSKVGDDLTDRELEVLALLAEGLSNAEIAQQLSISTSTVKHHVRAIRSKLSAANRAEAVSLAMRHDLI